MAKKLSEIFRSNPSKFAEGMESAIDTLYYKSATLDEAKHLLLFAKMSICYYSDPVSLTPSEIVDNAKQHMNKYSELFVSQFGPEIHNEEERKAEIAYAVLCWRK